MVNSFYTATGSPGQASSGASSVQRAEFLLIQSAFDKLPSLASPGTAVVVNPGGTGLTNTTGTLTLAGNLVTTGAFNLTFSMGASVTLTAPLVSGTLATLAGTEELTNKTLTASVGKGTWTASGTWTLPSLTLGGTTTLPGSGQISSAGLLGLGMTPANIIDVTQSGSNAPSIGQILNANGGNATTSEWRLSNGTSLGRLIQFGTSFATAGLSVANATMLRAEGAGGLVLVASASQPVSFGVNNALVASFGVGGGLSSLTGTTGLIATGTPTNIFGASGSKTAIYLVWINVSGGGVGTYESWAIIGYDPNGSLLSRIGGTNATTSSISTSGTNITAQQNSGSNQNIEWSVMKFGG
jgi:hypothetical protein